jgi:single-stranded-DNA-specific exonuclease
MIKRWVQVPEGNKDITDTLAQHLNIDTSLAKILVQRGITTFEEAKDFFRPQIEQLHNPFLMKDMDKAVENRACSVKEREHNGVWRL